MKYHFWTVVLMTTLLVACQLQEPNIATPTIPIPATPTLIPIETPMDLKTAVSPRSLTELELASKIHQTTIDIATALGKSTDAINLQTDVKLAIELIGIYETLYDEVSPEMVDMLIGIKVDLQQLESQLSSLTTSNLDISAPAERQQQSFDWFTNVQANIDRRENLYANVSPQPGVVAYNRVEAFTQAHDFLDATSSAFDDDKLSPNELAEISQLAANAKASFYNTGDHQIFEFAEQIDAISHHAFRGEWTQARDGLFALKFSLPARPRP